MHRGGKTAVSTVINNAVPPNHPQPGGVASPLPVLPNQGGATSPLPATPSRNRTKRQNQAIRKNSTIPQSNFYSSWGPSPEFPTEFPQKTRPTGRGNVPVARNPIPKPHKTPKIKLSAKTAQNRNQISTLLGIPPLNVQLSLNTPFSLSVCKSPAMRRIGNRL